MSKPPSHGKAHIRHKHPENSTNVNCIEICSTSFSKQTGKGDRPGFCVDIGAPRSVIGLKEARRSYGRTGRRLHPRPSNRKFRFADSVFESLGTVMVPLETPPVIPTIKVVLDVISADIPALLGMDVMDDNSLTPCTVSNRFIKKTVVDHENPSQSYVIDDWSVPLKRHEGHLYAQMSLPVLTFFSKAQLQKLHRHFFHPSSEKLYKLLKKARPEDTTPQTQDILEEITTRWDPCQRVQPGPNRFKVTFGGESVKFNEEVVIDIMYLDGKPVLHLVDAETHFSATRFLPDVSTRTVWSTIVQCWSSVYTGLPNKIRVDQGTAFGDGFMAIAKSSDVDVVRTGIESHSSMGIGERYHGPLRNTYRKLKLGYPLVDPSLLLSMSDFAMNNTLGPEGVVPSVLVFGEFPSLRMIHEPPTPKSAVFDRARVANAARKEIEHHMARLRLQRALRHRVPRSADASFQPGDMVLVWREKRINNRIGEWVGPYSVATADYGTKIVHVQESQDDLARPYNFAQVKPYISEVNVSHAFLAELHSGLKEYSTDVNGDVFLTEVLSPNDPRASSARMSEAKKAEIKGLLERGTFKVILREEVPPNANVLPGRFVLSIKSTEDGQERFKARYVIGGHRDRQKAFMVHTSQTLQPASVRLMLSFACIFGFEVWTSDVRQAYLQSAEPLSRAIYIGKPSTEFSLDPKQCLQLLTPLYGLCESGDLWHATLDKHHRQDLGMTPLDTDPALYYLVMDNSLAGLSGSYVDDIIRCGTDKFKSHCRSTGKRFEMSGTETIPCIFTGFRLSHDSQNFIQIDQRQYIQKLRPLPEDGTYKDLASLRMQLAWLSHSRPNLLFDVSQLTQVTEDAFEEDRLRFIKQANKTVKAAFEHNVTIKFPTLDLQTLRIIGISDASFANNRDLTSQLGFLLFLTDETDSVIPLIFKSYKARRVTRSVLAAELIAFVDLFHQAFAMASDVGKFPCQKKLPITLLTDSKSLFDILTKGSRTSEKRLMLDVAAAREGYRIGAISNIGFVRTAKNIADALTKKMCTAALREVLSTSKWAIKPDQWVIRTSVE